MKILSFKNDHFISIYDIIINNISVYERKEEKYGNL